MRVLIGCETSGRLRRAFAAHGHEAWSCDYLPADDGELAMHLQMDVRHVLRVMRGYWDMFIVHPTCTYLCSSGLHWNKRRPERAALTNEAVSFAVEMAEADVPRVVMENPIGCLSTRYRKPDQIIQPYQFGDDASKATCLWLRGVSPLQSVEYVEPRLVCNYCKAVFEYGLHKCPGCGSQEYKPRWSNQTDSGQNRLPPSADRWKLRSETYPGIADAMAMQWGAA
jgi:hypothetical protein